MKNENKCVKFVKTHQWRKENLRGIYVMPTLAVTQYRNKNNKEHRKDGKKKRKKIK